MKLGFIGLGSMGAGQAGLLARSSHELAVFDVSAAALSAFDGRAKLAGSVAEVGADADVVGLCVRDDDQVNACVDSLLPTMKPGAALLVHSTVRPDTVIGAARRAAERRIEVLDAAVTRTVQGTTAEPFVYCLTAGDEETARCVRSIIDLYATDTMHVGPLGSAMALKICNNLTSWCEILLGLEVVGLAEKAGVPTDMLTTVMKRNGVMTSVMQAILDARARMDQPEVRQLIASQAGIGEKDLMLAEGLGASYAAATPLASLARALVRETLVALTER